MDYKKNLVSRIETFYIDVVEEFKEIELKIMADSKFRSMFKKKDYDGNIRKLRGCKKQVQAVSVSDIKVPEKDKTGIEVHRKFEACLRAFSYLCDCHIQLQLALKQKSEKSDLKFSEYKEGFNRMQEARNSMNKALHELDIVYTDYTYSEDPYTFLD